MNRILIIWTIVLTTGAFILHGCGKSEVQQSAPNLILKFKFDPEQKRLNNTGGTSEIPAGNAGLSPEFREISAHYVELSESNMTQVGEGAVIYKGTETINGGDLAIDFDESPIVAEGEEFLKIPLSEVTAGTYEFIRVSLSYQNYIIPFRYTDQFGVNDLEGTAASFIGYNTYIRSYKTNQSTINVLQNKPQGYWSFETVFGVDSGSASGTTVPNPIAATSPIPPNSCLVTGAFTPGKLIITGEETKDIEVVLSLSTNQSFEWTEVNQDGKWEPGAGESVVDMGIRGLIPIVSK